MRSRDAEKVELNLREHFELGMAGRKGPRESEKDAWKVRGKSEAFRVMQVRQEERLTVKAMVSGEVKKGKHRNRPLGLKSKKLLVCVLQLKLAGINESGRYQQIHWSV